MEYIMKSLYWSYWNTDKIQRTYSLFYKGNQEIESQYSFIEKILWILSNKSDKIIINWLKTQHNLYIWKEVIIYQNPNDPEDLVMKDPFEN